MPYLSFNQQCQMSRSEVQIVWRQQLRSSFQPPAYSWGRRAVASFKPTVNIKGCPRHKLQNGQLSLTPARRCVAWVKTMVLQRWKLTVINMKRSVVNVTISWQQLRRLTSRFREPFNKYRLPLVVFKFTFMRYLAVAHGAGMFMFTMFLRLV